MEHTIKDNTTNRAKLADKDEKEMNKILALIAALVLSLAFPLTSLAEDHSNKLDTIQETVSANASVASTGRPTLTVRAYIDGRSDLILHRNTVHWHHFDYAAPGRIRREQLPYLSQQRRMVPHMAGRANF